VFFCQLEFVDFSANPFGLIRIVREKREGLSPFVASLWKGILFFELVSFCGNANEFFAVEQRVALRAIQRAKRHGLPAIVAIANGFKDGRRGHGWRIKSSGCGPRCRRAALEGANDIDFRGAGLLPGEAHANKQNYETNRTVEEILQC